MTYLSEVLADSPKGYWRLGESAGPTATDTSGLGHDGTYTGCTFSVVGALADGDTAVTLDATDDQVSVTHHTDLAIAADLTLEAWVKPTDRATYYAVVGKYVSNGARPYEFRLQTGTGLPTLIVDTSNTELLATTAPTTGVWSHIAVTVSGTTYTHYLNGATNGTGTIVAARQSDGSAALLIGARGDAALFFKGSMDEVAVYASALSGARVQAHFDAADDVVVPGPARTFTAIPFMR